MLRERIANAIFITCAAVLVVMALAKGAAAAGQADEGKAVGFAIVACLVTAATTALIMWRLPED